MKKGQKGIVVSVLRDADGYDCTNGGPSAKYKEFVLIDESIKNPDTLPSKDRPAIKLVERNIFGDIYLQVEPLVQPKGKNGPMFGGNYVVSSEARFTNNFKHPIPIHDRFE